MEVETDVSSKGSWDESEADSEGELETDREKSLVQGSANKRKLECVEEPSKYLEESSEDDGDSSEAEEIADIYAEETLWEDELDEHLREIHKENEIALAAAKKQAEKDRHEILLQAIYQGRHSDLHFICKHGSKLYSSKILCTGRSKELDAIIGSELSTLKVSVVKVSYVPSQALASIIEFLYTGDINRYPPVDWEAGLEILRTAHVFGLPHVDKIVDRFLLEDFKELVTDEASPSFKDLCKLLNSAMELEFLRQRDDLISLSRLAYHLRWKWLHRDFAGELSEDAADFILQRTRRREIHHWHGNEICLMEYFHLYGVLHWAACKYEKDLDGIDLDELFAQMPIDKKQLYRTGNAELKEQNVVWLPGYSYDDASNLILEMLEMHKPCKEAVLRLAKHIDWGRIPAPLFLHVVEPLKLVPDCQLLEIYRSHCTQSGSCESLKVKDECS